MVASARFFLSRLYRKIAVLYTGRMDNFNGALTKAFAKAAAAERDARMAELLTNEWNSIAKQNKSSWDQADRQFNDQVKHPVRTWMNNLVSHKPFAINSGKVRQARQDYWDARERARYFAEKAKEFRSSIANQQQTTQQ